MDKRASNGNKGHSTKAKEGKLDKRRNEYKAALAEACTVDDVVNVLRTVRNSALSADMQAAKLFLEYYLGKPDSVVKLEGDGLNINVKEILKFDSPKREV